jgi:predicted transcriptional regulator
MGRTTEREYWWGRLGLLKDIQKNGRITPFSHIIKPYYTWGSQIKILMDDLRDRGIVTFIKDSGRVRSYLTEKGEKVVRILSELKEVWGE